MAGKRQVRKKTEESQAGVIDVRRGNLRVFVLGRTPLICNRMSEKAKQELLFPFGPKNRAVRTSTLKHFPMEEYRDSPYRNTNNDAPTRLQALSIWFKGCLLMGALDAEGIKATEIGRRVQVEQDRIDLYGVPQIYSAVVRNSGFPPTPDIRTRAILPRWACVVDISFLMRYYTGNKIFELLALGGRMAGVGDFRVGKGKGNYGQFELVDPAHPEFLEIMKEDGREAQDEALQNPAFYDDETATLLNWFDEELVRRSKDAAPKKAVEDAIAAD